jgi:hypothetical protein
MFSFLKLINFFNSFFLNILCLIDYNQSTYNTQEDLFDIDLFHVLQGSHWVVCMWKSKTQKTIN